MDDDVTCEICMTDSLKVLTKKGYVNLCCKFGSVKNITIHKYSRENQAFIEFEDKTSIDQILNDGLYFPYFVKVELSQRTQRSYTKSENKKNEDIDDKCKIVNIQEANNRNSAWQSIYLGTHISGSAIIEESKKLKLNDNKIQSYNLENDNLFGKPLNSKWENDEKLSFELHNVDSYTQFAKCMGGEIKIEKKLGPNIFTGRITNFDNKIYVQDILKTISNDIERSYLLNIKNLKHGMLVGAFDSVTNLYGRGYVTLVAGNSVNVALSDFGRVVNTTKIRSLPEKYTQLPVYLFKVYTKENVVTQIKKSTYIFKVHNVSAEGIVLIIFTENNEIKVQLIKWHPTVEESGIPHIYIKSGSKINLLKVKDMNLMYIESIEKDHMHSYSSFWNSLASYCYKNPQPLNREPYYGEIVGFKSTLGNKNYVRGRIHKYLGENIYYVKQMDYPIKENVKLSEMIELPFRLKNMPVNMLKVGLKDKLPYPIQFYAKQFMDFVLENSLIMHFDESNVEGLKNVVLNLSQVKENVNDILFNLLDALWLRDLPINSNDDESTNFLSYSDILKNELKEKSVVNMKFTMYHNGIFYMRDKSFGKSFSLLSDMIREYCSVSLHPYLPHDEEVCLGKYPDGMWYRVTCDKLTAGKLVQVHSVDLGTVAFLNSTNMKKLPIELTFHPIHVYKCILDCSKVDSEKIKDLEKYQNIDCEFTVLKHLVDTNHYVINCPFLENILQ